MLHHASLERVALHVPSRRQQMMLIENTGPKAPLKQIATNTFGEILPPRVTAMGFADGAGQRIVNFWDGNQMNVVGHQTPGDKADSKTQGFLFHDLEVSKTILVVGKNIYGANTSLGDMVGITWDNESGETSHAETLGC